MPRRCIGTRRTLSLLHYVLMVTMVALLLRKQMSCYSAYGWILNPGISRPVLSVQKSTRSIKKQPSFLRIASVSTPTERRDFNNTTSASVLPNKINEGKLATTAAANIIDLSDHYEWTKENWREHPGLNPTLTFPTWAVSLENAKAIQTLLSSNLTQPFLATRDETMQQIHPRPKIVRDSPADPERKARKYILLHPSLLQDTQQQSLPTRVVELLDELRVDTKGPNMTISVQYHQFPVSYILERLLPEEVHPVPTAFETVGHVAHLNLRSEHVPYAELIGQVLLECLPTIQTVIHKVGQVSGPYRTYDYQVLAGRNDTTVQLMEHGVKIEFDLSKVYWCSRLAQERQIVLDQEIKPGQVIADAFSGVGAILLRAAQTKNCTILANDWNPNAVEYLKNNFALNKLERYLAHSCCQDAYDFLMDLGLQDNSEEDAGHTPKPLIVDHVLMNFPLKAPSFLGALRWWSEPLCSSRPRLHVYTFARADPDTHRSAEEVAVDLIASELLPPMGNSKENDEGMYRRKEELNDEYGCNVISREVRDVAPGKIVFCVSFTATPRLLCHMQGDFV